MEHDPQTTSADEHKPQLPDHLPPAVEEMFEEHPPRVGRSGMTREQFLHERSLAPRRWAHKIVERSLQDSQ